MRWSKYFLPTFKENPAEAEIPSHRLMLRAGLIRKLTSGIYTFLPLGFRVLKKVETIVREEMDAIGCQEVLMPILHPIEIYEESGRIKSFGSELFKIKDSKNRLFALGPTHEEVITLAARDELKSYKDLPQCYYQILTKFRDEIRPRYGVIRAREFIMKDAYSFHADEESLDETYKAMEKGYRRIIERCGLDYRMVEAESGYIGGNESHEFMVLAENGEDEILSCSCGYAVNLEKGSASINDSHARGEENDSYREIETPGKTTVDDVSKFLEVDPSMIVKTLLYMSKGKVVAILVPGDRDLNDIKLVKVLDDPDVRFLDEDEITELTGAPVGFSGPVGLPKGTKIYADNLIKGYTSMIVGANKADRHLIGVKAGRDFSIDHFADLVWAKEGDACPRCGKAMSINKGIEVGHIFKLGTKYSSAMNATFLDADGKSKAFIMGCYGFGVTRMVAAVIEQNCDENGIVWPVSLAPFPLEILPVNANDEKIWNTAVDFEAKFKEAGVDVLVDDRNLSPGVKFKDADLVGIPFRLTIGKKLNDGKVEFFSRAEKSIEEIPVEKAFEVIMERLGNLNAV